jgi:hypothetical protein
MVYQSQNNFIAYKALYKNMNKMSLKAILVLLFWQLGSNQVVNSAEHKRGLRLRQLVGTASDPSRMCPEVPVPPCFPESTRIECQKLVDDGCINILSTRSCPAIFFCGEYQNETPVEETKDNDDDDSFIEEGKPDKNTSAESFICPSPTATCMNDAAYDTCIELQKEKCTSIAVRESCPVQFFCLEAPIIDAISDQPSSTPSVILFPGASFALSDAPSLAPSDVPSDVPSII